MQSFLRAALWLTLLAAGLAGACPRLGAADRVAHHRPHPRSERRRPAWRHRHRHLQGHRRRAHRRHRRDGTYTITNLGPGTYTITAELDGFQPTTRDVVLGVGQVSSQTLSLGVAALTETVTVSAAAPVLDTSSARIGVNVSPGRSRAAAGQRPQLRQPDDPGHRRHLRRQRRLGERALQRQVEPAELPELRRRRRHLRVGRQPRLPERHRLAVPPADVDGVGGRVPRQLRPGAGRERARRRRQHHRGQQERQQPLPRLALRVPPRRRARLGAASTTTRSRSSSWTSSAARSAGRSAQHDLLLRQLRGPAPDDRPRPSPKRCRAPKRAAASWPASRSAPAPGRAPIAPGPWRPLLNGLPRRARCRPRTRSSTSTSLVSEADQQENTALGPPRPPVHRQPLGLRPLHLQHRRGRHARPHRDPAPRAAPSSRRRTSWRTSSTSSAAAW